MLISKKFLAAALPLLALGACAAPFQAKVARFQSLPVPQGQTFDVRAGDPDLRGGLEFRQYADLVAQRLEHEGYRRVSGAGPADLIVTIDYSVDHGREKIDSVRGGGFGFGFRDSGFYRPYYGRRGRLGFAYGWSDPWAFGYGGYGNDITSFTIYTSELDMRIERAGSRERVFEGTAKAVSRSDDLPYLIPNLVEAMFTGFPGNSGETVKITIPPPRRGS